ncbi:MAG: aminotransferase class I/II-fold pyridoxal phosphate-dependent enzyme [Myxococcota bacterium]
MSAIDLSSYFVSDPSAARQMVSPVIADMLGSKILKIAGEVRAMMASGRSVCNLTVGDFRPQHFPIPAALSEQVQRAYVDQQTNYPPADGIPELKQAVADLYTRELGLAYGPESVCIGSGARPPLYGSWALFTQPGDQTVSFLPAWNNGYYAHLFQTKHVYVPTTAETNFFPTIDQVREILPGTRMVAMNSPLNPTGTAISKDVLAGIAQAIVEENQARSRRGEAPAMVLYDQVYWMLTASETRHHNPVQLVPEIAPYVVNVDAISKCFAATGLRVGWAVLPPYLQGRMRALIGHVGAWAPRPEQVATAWLLNHPDVMHAYMAEMRARIAARLNTLYDGITAMKSRGLPVEAISPQGGIYLSFRVNLIGRGFSTNEEIRHYLLNSAGVAVVPFQAFDLTDDSGWFRMSVGAVGVGELDDALERIEKAIQAKL